MCCESIKEKLALYVDNPTARDIRYYLHVYCPSTVLAAGHGHAASLLRIGESPESWAASVKARSKQTYLTSLEQAKEQLGGEWVAIIDAVKKEAYPEG